VAPRPQLVLQRFVLCLEVVHAQAKLEHLLPLLLQLHAQLLRFAVDSAGTAAVAAVAAVTAS
jgi:hypothetical protein